MHNWIENKPYDGDSTCSICKIQGFRSYTFDGKYRIYSTTNNFSADTPHDILDSLTCEEFIIKNVLE